MCGIVVLLNHSKLLGNKKVGNDLLGIKNGVKSSAKRQYKKED